MDFFKDRCKTSSHKGQFGLCDDTPPPARPAYIDDSDNEQWIATINNPKLYKVDFYAIDNCVQILRDDGRDESRCDGFIYFNNSIVFIELKSREGGQWVKKGREQLTKTINIFKQDHPFNNFNTVSASVCNNLRPRFNIGHMQNIQKFKDETGIILKTEDTINLE